VVLLKSANKNVNLFLQLLMRTFVYVGMYVYAV